MSKSKNGKRLFTAGSVTATAPGTAASTRPGTRSNTAYSGDGEVAFSKPVPAQPKSDCLQGTEPPSELNTPGTAPGTERGRSRTLTSERVQTGGTDLHVTIEEEIGAEFEEDASIQSSSDSDSSDYSTESDEDHPHHQERPHEQLYPKLHIDPETFKPTISPNPSVWYLVYIGTDTKYACTGVLSDSVLVEEPGLTVPVAFMVQTCGTEFPKEEHSMCSDPLVVWTKIPEVIATGVEGSSPTGSHESWDSAMSPIDSKSGSPSKTGGGQKKKKSDRFQYADIPGHGEVEIERQYYTYMSNGVSDHYM